MTGKQTEKKFDQRNRDKKLEQQKRQASRQRGHEPNKKKQLLREAAQGLNFSELTQTGGQEVATQTAEEVVAGVMDAWKRDQKRRYCAGYLAGLVTGTALALVFQQVFLK